LTSGGDNNVAIGRLSMGNASSKFISSVAIGYGALNGASNGSNSVSHSIGIGYSAGQNMIGRFNTLIGNSTGASNSNTIEYSTAIGYAAKFDESNQIMLGRSSEKVVIPGDASFNNNLNVNGDVSLNSRLYVEGDLSWNPSNIADNSIPNSAIIGFAGIIVMWSGAVNDIPTGWVLCDGGSFTDPTLGTTKTTPDLRSKFIIGHDARDTSFNIDSSGGSFLVEPFTEPQLPRKAFGLGTVNDNMESDSNFKRVYYSLAYIMKT